MALIKSCLKSDDGALTVAKVLYTGSSPNGEIGSGNKTYTVSEGVDSYKYIVIWANQGDSGKAIVRCEPILMTPDEFAANPITFTFSTYTQTVTLTDNNTITVAGGGVLGAVITLLV